MKDGYGGDTMIKFEDYIISAADLGKENPKTEADKELCAAIKQQNILIIDDIATSGSTLNEILRTLRILNEDNRITIFSLIGRKDLMVESM